MITYTKKQLTKILKIDFVKFCIVGGLGFVINFTILGVLHKVLDWPLIIAQLIGAEIALFSNFLLHHHWTYKNRSKRSLTSLIIQFHAVSWPAILGSTVMVSFGVRVLHLSDFLALAASSAIALVWNFAWSKYVIWRKITPSDIEKITD